MYIGKAETSLLDKLLTKAKHTQNHCKELILGPAIGEDSAILNFNSEWIAISSDPITGASKHLGELAIHVNVNDIAASGCVPVGIVLTILMPPQASKEELLQIMDEAVKTASDCGVVILGGHTEFTQAVTRPVISACCIGKTINKKHTPSSNCKVGDDIVISKTIGLEGTFIIASDYFEQLKTYIPLSYLNEAKELRKQLSIVKESEIARKLGAHAMHDVTEGGVAGALWEIGNASKLGLLVNQDEIPIHNSTRAICDYLGIDPYRLIGCGSLLMVTENGDELVLELQKENIPAAVIGKMTEKKLCWSSKGKTMPLPEPKKDELFRILEQLSSCY